MKESGGRNSATGSFIGDHNMGFISSSSASAPAQERMDRKGLTDKSRYPIPPQRLEYRDRGEHVGETNIIRNIRRAVARKDM